MEDIFWLRILRLGILSNPNRSLERILYFYDCLSSFAC